MRRFAYNHAAGGGLILFYKRTMRKAAEDSKQAMSKARFSNDINVRNRQATFEYELLDKYIAGIVLTGTEIKSIREGKINLQDGYCYLNNGQVFAKGINITPYAQGTHYNHEATRERKLQLEHVYPQLQAEHV